MIALKVIMKPQEIPNWKETPDTIHLKSAKTMWKSNSKAWSLMKIWYVTQKTKGYIKIDEEVYKLKR